MERLIAAGPNIDIFVATPSTGVNAATSPGVIVGNVFTIIIIIAVLAVLFMLIIGAFQWIMSGGDKEAVGKARNRITHALIGLAILALAWVIVTVVGSILNIDLFNQLKEGLPRLDRPR